MNEYQAALIEIKKNINKAYMSVCYNKATKAEFIFLEQSTIMCTNTLMELVNKATPMKPKEVDEGCELCNEPHCYCPKCGVWLGNRKYKFCTDCGQALDWE